MKKQVKMKTVRWIILIIFIILIIGIVSIYLVNKQRCDKRGFFIKNSWTCETLKKDFECTGKIELSKGTLICNHLIDNYNEIDDKLNISFNKSESINNYHIKGKAWQGYIPCKNNEEDYMTQAVCNYIYNEYLLSFLKQNFNLSSFTAKYVKIY